MTKQEQFIAQIAPVIIEEARTRGYKVVSPIIAQACCESAYGTSSLGWKYHNYFGMKCGSKWTGRSVNMATMEEYTVGTYTKIQDNFRVYGSLKEGVAGYFDFISTSRYSSLKNCLTAKSYLETIKAAGYATSSKYVDTNMAIVSRYKLTDYDMMLSSEPQTPAPQTLVKIQNDEDIYYSKYVGNSQHIDEVFKAILVNLKYVGNWKNRKPIAEANGIHDYVGSSSQNLKLIQMAKNGQLKRP